MDTVLYSAVLCCVLFLQEFELRKLARSEGRRYCNAIVLTYQAERMPEQIRLNVSHGWSHCEV